MIHSAVENATPVAMATAEAVATKTAELRQQAREHFEDERVQQSLAVARERVAEAGSWASLMFGQAQEAALQAYNERSSSSSMSSSFGSWWSGGAAAAPGGDDDGIIRLGAPPAAGGGVESDRRAQRAPRSGGFREDSTAGREQVESLYGTL